MLPREDLVGVGRNRASVGAASTQPSRTGRSLSRTAADARRTRARSVYATTTVVPIRANSYTSGASERGIRTHPCDAGCVGTSGDSWKAIPPVK